MRGNFSTVDPLDPLFWAVDRFCFPWLIWAAEPRDRLFSRLSPGATSDSPSDGK